MSSATNSLIARFSALHHAPRGSFVGLSVMSASSLGRPDTPGRRGSLMRGGATFTRRWPGTLRPGTRTREDVVHLVVVGDTLLDVDLVGTATRLCPDAPVPVVDLEHREERAGGAGLTAAIAAADGLAVTLVTAVAAD